MFVLEIFAQQSSTDTTPKILLGLAAFVLIFGIAVVVVGRHKSEQPKLVSAVEIVTPAATVDSTQVAVVGLREKLSSVRSTFSGAVATALIRSSITQETWDELEEALLRADVGVATTTRVLAPLRDLVKAKKIVQPSELLAALQSEMTAQLSNSARELNFDRSLNAPNIWLVVGVNGAGSGKEDRFGARRHGGQIAK